MTVKSAGIQQGKDESEQQHVYHLARREWMERYGNYIAQRDQWRLAALIAMGVAGIAVFGLVSTMSQSRVTPYVVEVDKLGRPVYSHMVEETSPVDRRIIRATVARWISNVRSVYLDANAEQMVIDEVYALLNNQGSAYGMLNEHFQQHSPFKRAKTEAVSVEIESVDPLGDSSWKVEWIESVYSRDGTLREELLMEAVIGVVVNTPKNPDNILQNPLGIYIDSYKWSKRLQ